MTSATLSACPDSSVASQLESRLAARFAFIDPTRRIEWAAPDRGIFRIIDLLEQRGEFVEPVADWISATRADPTE